MDVVRVISEFKRGRGPDVQYKVIWLVRVRFHLHFYFLHKLNDMVSNYVVLHQRIFSHMVGPLFDYKCVVSLIISCTDSTECATSATFDIPIFSSRCNLAGLCNMETLSMFIELGILIEPSEDKKDISCLLSKSLRGSSIFGYVFPSQAGDPCTSVGLLIVQ